MLNFKKISAIGASALMVGLTMGTAAAANYPAPFVQGSTADVAIVYGTGAGVSVLDAVEAGNIQSDLQTSLGGTGSISVEGGEAFMLDKSSNHFNLGDNLNTVYSVLDDDEMDFLADGTYDDGDVDEDFEQRITLGNKQLAMFADPDYNDDAPTLGFRWANNEHILNYTFELDDAVSPFNMDDTEIPLLGGSYYVLSASATQIELLDTAEKHSLNLGETATIGGRSVEVAFVDSNSVRFIVDGETTDSLSENEEFELEDGAYIVPTDIDYQDFAGGVQGATFSIGSGKLTIANGDEVQANDEDVDNLLGFISGNVTSITLQWNSDGETFLAEGDSIVMPGFGVIGLAFGGVDFPSDSETIAVQNGETLTIQMDNYDLPLIWYEAGVAAASQNFGEEDHVLKVATEDWNITTAGNMGAANYSADVGLNLTEDNRFIVVSMGTDLSDVETLYYEVDTIEDDAGEILVELNDLIGSNDLTFDALESDDVGTVTVQLLGVTNASTPYAYLNFSSDDTIYFNRAVSDSGLTVSWVADAADASDGDGLVLTFTEADRDEDLASGGVFTATVRNTSNDELHVASHNVTDEEESTDNLVGYVLSDLASKVMFDTSADENEFSVEYYGSEVTADVQVVAGGEVTTVPGGALGEVLVTDDEISSVDDKNLIVVGGSCINTVAAEVLGSGCGADFTETTGVGSGQFLIQSVGDVYTEGKIALVVAGYDVADTVNAARYLRNQDVDTAEGNKYIGTSETSAELQ